MEKTTYSTWEYKGIGVTGIAKLIRKDIKKEIPDIKSSVRVERYSMGRSINVTILEVPFIVMNPYFNRDGDFSEDNQMYNDSARAVLKHIKEIMSRYNYDNSDAQSDYYEVGFSGFVNFARELEEKRSKSRENTQKMPWVVSW